MLHSGRVDLGEMETVVFGARRFRRRLPGNDDRFGKGGETAAGDIKTGRPLPNRAVYIVSTDTPGSSVRRPIMRRSAERPSSATQQAWSP